MKSRTLSIALACIAWAFVPYGAFGWNSLGHKVVCQIAWTQLTPQQRQSIVDTLRRHPRFDKDFAAKMDDNALTGEKSIEDHWIFLQAATWPDIIRKDKEFDRPEWHYIDFPQFLDDSDRAAFAFKLPVNIATDYPGSVPREKYNIIQAIELCRETLRGKAGPNVKAQAYCWLMHLAGDIHQPLHCTALFSVGHFPKGDRGGNEIKLNRGKNLHSLWDNLLGRESYMRNVLKAELDISDKERYGEIWNSAAKDTDPRKWAKESHALCESFVYPEAIYQAVRDTPTNEEMPPVDLPEAYFTTAGEHARKRVIAAGVRLANLLRDANGGHPVAPAGVPPVNSLTPTQQMPRPKAPSPALTAVTPKLKHWLTDKTGIRHNSSCRYYHSSAGHACGAADGKPCKICGG